MAVINNRYTLQATASAALCIGKRVSERERGRGKSERGCIDCLWQAARLTGWQCSMPHAACSKPQQPAATAQPREQQFVKKLTTTTTIYMKKCCSGRLVETQILFLFRLNQQIIWLSTTNGGNRWVHVDPRLNREIK